MSKARVLALVDELSREYPLPLTIESGTVSGHYLDAVLKRSPEIITKTAITVDAQGGEQQPWPDKAVDLVVVFFDGEELSRIDIASAESLMGEEWRSVKGDPSFYVVEGETEKSLRLVPAPRRAATLTLLHTEARTNYPDWADLALAADVLALEYRVESKRRDPDLSAAWSRVGDLLWTMVG